VFEWRVGRGRLLVCGLRLADSDPGGAYFRHALLQYASGEAFQPRTVVSVEQLARLAKLGVPVLREEEKTEEAFDEAGQLPPTP